jgi:hypothetical protein
MKPFVTGKKSLNIKNTHKKLEKQGNKNTTKYGKQLKNSDSSERVLQYLNKKEMAKRVGASGAGYVLGRGLMTGYNAIRQSI